MFNQVFADLIDEFGVEIHLNGEPHKAIINSKGLSRSNDYDDRVIHTDFLIKRGDNIRYGDTDYIVISDVQNKRVYEYKGIIRPATNGIPIVVQEEEREYLGRDEIGNPIWGDVIQEEIIEDYPAIVFQDKIGIDGQQIKIVQTEIKVTITDDEHTAKIEKDDKYEMIEDSWYKVIDVDLFQRGLRIIKMESTTNPD